MKRLPFIIGCFLLIVGIAAAPCVAATHPNNSQPGVTTSTTQEHINLRPTLASDRPDYYPGEIVNLTGTGWAPNEVVTMVMTVVPETHGPVTLTATSDASGSFTNTDYVVQKSDLGVKFYVTAKDANAETSPLLTFTDAIGTPTSIGTGSHSAAGTIASLAVPVTVAVPLDNTVIVTAVMSTTAANTITVTDSVGNTYTKNADVADSGPTRTVVFSAPVTAALSTSNSVTLHFSTSFRYVFVSNFQVSGLVVAVSAVDQSATNSNTSGSVSASVGPTPTTTQANELLIGALGLNINSGNVPTFTAGAGYTALTQDVVSGDWGIYPEYQIVNATGAYSATGSWPSGSAIDWAADIVTFKGAATKLAFSTAPVDIIAGVCSPQITVQSQDANGNAASPASTETIALSTSGVGGAFWSNNTCTTSITSVTIAASANSASFFWTDTTAGSPVITATGTGAFSSAPTQTETVTTPTNPVPTISSLSPPSATAGAAAQTLTINGTGFISTSTATYNGVAHTVTFTSSTVISITLTTADLATAGSFPVIVTNPAPGGGASNTVNFLVTTAPTIAKAFNPTTMALSGTSTLTLTITNPSATQTQTGVAVTDTFPSGLVVASPNGASDNGCGGTYTATAGTGSITLTGGSLAVSSSCTLVVNVSATSAGSKANTTGAVSSTNGGTGGTASATLTVVSPPTITKSFAAASMAQTTGTTTMTITISNPAANTVALSGVAVTDNLPAGMTQTGVATSCTSGSVASSTSTSIVLGGASIPTSGSCTVTATVSDTTSGVASNTTGPVSSTNGGTGLTANATIAVEIPPTITKSFAAAEIAPGGTSTLTITITNPAANTVALTGVAVSDALPSGVVVATPNGASTTCTGGTESAVAGSGTVSLTGGSINAGASCNVIANVTAAAVGSYVNTTGTVSATNGGTGGTAMATLTVAAPPTITKSFTPASIASGQTTTLAYTITNPATNAGAMNGIAATDTFPAGLTVASTPNLSNTCGGTISGGASGNSTLSLSGGSIATPGATCTVSVSVTSTTAGNSVNTTGAVSSTNYGTGTTATATLNVVTPPTITKAFGAGAAGMPVNGTSTMTITITNPAANTVAQSGVIVSDTFPSGMTVTGATLATTCSGGLTGGTVGLNTFSVNSSTVVTGGNCTVTGSVTDTTAGTATNTTGAVSSTNGGTGLTASANLVVNNPPTVTKTFSPTTVGMNVASLLTITITNPDTVSLTGVAITDTLPSGLVISTPNGGSDTGCTGATFTDTAGTGVVSISGATVAVGTPCVIKVNVQSATPNTYNNTTGTVSSTNGGTGTTASASLTVTPTAAISTVTVGTETPANVYPGQAATYTITTTWTGTGTCTSAPVTINWTAPTGATAAFSPTTVASNSTSTTLTISNTTSTPLGSTNFTVTVASTGGTGQCATGSVTSATNTYVVATATINGVTVGSQSPNPVVQTNTASYTVSGQWVAGTSGVVGVNCTSNPVSLTWQSAPPNDTNPTFTPTTISSSGSTSTLMITTANDTPPGTYTFAVTASNNQGNGCTTTNSTISSNATLVVTGNAAPSITKTFLPTNIAPNTTSTLTLSLSASASDTSTLTGVAVSDPLPSGMQVASTPGATNTCGGTFSAPASATTISLTGGSLAAGASCAVSVSVTVSTPGTYTNTTGNVTATNVGYSGGNATATLTVYGPATRLVFGTQPSNAAVSTTITPAITLQVEDASGNVVTNSTASITMAVGTNPGNGSLNGTLTQPSASGVATFPDLSINRTGNGYTLVATSTGLTPATSNAFNIVQGSDNYTEPFNLNHGWTWTQSSCGGGTCTPAAGSATNTSTDCQVAPCVAAEISDSFAFGTTMTGYYHNPSGYTWQTIGVPAGATVVSVQGSFWDAVVSTGSGCESGTSTTAGMHIYNAANTGTDITSAAVLPDTSVASDGTTGVTHGPGSVVTVLAGSTASSTGITLRFDLNPSFTASLGSGTCTIYGDSFNLLITYNLPTGGRRGQVIIGFMRMPDGDFQMTKPVLVSSTQDNAEDRAASANPAMLWKRTE